ncbi:MAG: hypothetical protein JXR96_22810 [Deltaproteobacteria bacterium]|nr:hypothetical protein [Deltaproteobacteria bacterium]
MSGSRSCRTILLLGLFALACSAEPADPQGLAREPVWLRTFGTAWSTAAAAALDEDGSLLVLGNTQSEQAGRDCAWLVRISAEGTLLREMQFWQAEGGMASALVTDPSGGLLVSGTVQAETGARAALLALDDAWDVRWQRCYGEFAQQSASALARDGEGNLVLAGLASGEDAARTHGWIARTDPGGELLWQRHLERGQASAFRALAVTGEGMIAAAGYTGSPSGQDRDGWIALLDPEGELVRELTPGGARQDELHALISGESGGIIAAGKTFSRGAGDFDQWVVAYDSDGDALWESVTGGESCECAQTLVQQGAGRLVTAGWTQTYGAGGYDVWLSALDGRGEVLWRHCFGGPDEDEAAAVLPGPGGGYFLAGSSISYADEAGGRVAFAALFVP